MSAPWYYTKDGQQQGPITHDQLRQMAAAGLLQPTDMVWQQGMKRWIEAHQAPGLQFRSSSAPPPLANVQPPTKSSAYELAGKARSLAGSLASRGKAAAQLLAKQAERTKLANVDIPYAYQALGKYLHVNGHLRNELPDRYQVIDKLVADIQAVQARAPGQPQAAGVAAKAKAMAKSAADIAQVKTLQVRLNHALGELGKAAFERYGDQCGPAELTQPIMNLRSRMESLDAEIRELSKTASGQIITPKRIAVAGVVAAALVLVGVGFHFLGSHGDVPRQRPDEIVATYRDNQHDPTDTRTQDVEVRDTSQDVAGSSEVDSLTDKFPEEIQQVISSPRGDRVLLVMGGKTRGVLMSVPDLKEVMAASNEYNHFSTPAAFSPDGRFLACLDGELLRIWNMATTPASLSNTLSAWAQSDNDSWNEVAWALDGTLVCRNSQGGFQFLRSDPTKGAVLAASVGKGRFGTYSPPGQFDKRLQFGLMGGCLLGKQIVISPNGQFFATLRQPEEDLSDRDLGVCLWAIPSGNQMKMLVYQAPSGSVGLQWDFHGLDVSRDGTIVGVGLHTGATVRPAMDETWLVVLWRNDANEKRVVLKGQDAHDGPGRLTQFSLAGFSPDGRLVATTAAVETRTSAGTKDRRFVTLWKSETGEKVRQFDDVTTGVVSFSRDGRTLIVGATNDRPVYAHAWEKPDADTPQSVQFFDVASGQKRFAVTDSGISNACVTSDGQWLIATYRRKADYIRHPSGQGTIVRWRYAGEQRTPVRVWAVK